jgi:hypothetical protein
LISPRRRSRPASRAGALALLVHPEPIRRVAFGMSPEIRPGALVLVRWAGVPHASPCHLHPTSDLPLFQNVGVVDRIDHRRGDHCVIGVFWRIACPPFGSPWVDAFTLDELEPIDPPL